MPTSAARRGPMSLESEMDEISYDMFVKVVDDETTDKYGIRWGYVARIEYLDTNGSQATKTITSPFNYNGVREAYSDGIWAGLEFMEAHRDGWLTEYSERRTYKKYEDGWVQSATSIPIKDDDDGND